MTILTLQSITRAEYHQYIIERERNGNHLHLCIKELKLAIYSYDKEYYTSSLL